MSREDNSRAFVLGFALARLEMQGELDQSAKRLAAS